jgi:hypothetical protein
MKPRSRRRTVAVLLSLLAGSAVERLALAADPAFEDPGTFLASRYLPPAELSGAEWKVAPQATSDGAFNLYTLENRFGPLEARGRSALARRVKEVEAMAELERVSKTKVFTDAVVASAVAPVKVVASFAENPTETVKGVSGGVKRLWSKTKFQVKEVSHDARETVAEQRKSDAEGGPSAAENTQKAKEATTAYAKKYLGLSGAERRWYAELGVDPYTDNAGLQKAVKEVSRVEAAARFGMRFAGLPSIPGVSEISKVMDLVWKTDPWELRARNRKILLDAGLSEDDARAFEDNAAMSPTLQSVLIQSLVDLQGVKGRVQIVERAIDADDADSGRMLVTSTALLVRYHQQVGPLAEILRGSRLPAAKAKSGALVATVLADAIFWTADIAEGVNGFVSSYAEVPATARELRVAGVVSDRFKSEAKARGWAVIDGWQVDAPEDRKAATKPAA